MVGGANAGAVYVQLELTGVKAAESKLKQFQRSVDNAMQKAKRSVDSFGRKFAASMAKVRKAMRNTFANAAVGAVLFAGLADGIKQTLALERAQVSLNTSLGVNGVKAYEFATTAAKKYGLGLTSTVQSFSKFTAAATAANIPLKVQTDLFDAVTRTAVTFGMTADETQGAFMALQQMASKGAVSMEELRQQLGERVPIALAAAARGFGVTSAKLIEMVEGGKLAASEFFPALTKGLNEMTGGEINTLTVQMGKLKNSWDEFVINLSKDFAVPVLDSLVKKSNEFITNLKTAGKWGQLTDLANYGDNFQWISNDDRGVAVNGIESLATTFKDAGINYEKAFEAYAKIVNGGEKIGSVKAFEKTFDLLEKQTRELRDQQEAQQNGIKAAAAADKLAQDKAKWEKKSLKTIDETVDARRKELGILISSRQKVARAQGLSNTSDSYGALGTFAKARLRQEAAQQRMMVVGDSKSASMEDRNSVYNAFSKSVVATKDAAKEAALLITEAYEKAKQAASDAAKKLSGARTEYASLIGSPKQGVGQFMSSQGNALRQEKAIKILQDEARKARSRLIKSMGPGDISRDFAVNTQRFKSGSVNDAGELKQFINAVNTELGAADGVESAQKELTTANKDLEEVIKVQTEAAKALGAPLEALSKQFSGMLDQFNNLSSEFNDLVNKDWNVFVNVPGGSATGDATTVEELF